MRLLADESVVEFNGCLRCDAIKTKISLSRDFAAKPFDTDETNEVCTLDDVDSGERK